MELVVQPRGGATALHTDRWTEVFYVLDGEVEWTLERDGRLDTWIARQGETVVVPSGAKHRFAGAGERPCRMLTMGRPSTSHSSAPWLRRGRTLRSRAHAAGGGAGVRAVRNAALRRVTRTRDYDALTR